jgi:hypothetical protein
MSATPEFVAEVATGYPAVPLPNYDQLVCIVGCAHSGTYEPRPWGSSDDIATEYTSGPACRDGRHLVSRSNLGLLIQRVESTTPGSYGTIDNSAFTGTAVPAVVASVVPRDEGEGYILIANGGTLGVDGITYYASDDNGRLGATELFRLGTSTRITLTTLNAAVEFDPPTAQGTVFIALAVEIRADLIAHFANAVAHNSADATAAALITLAAPTTGAEAWAVLNECRLAWASHLGNDTAHDSTDVYNTLSAPAAVSIQGGIVIAIELKADINSHLAATYPASAAALKAGTLSSVAVQVYDVDDLIAAGVTQGTRYPSLITFTTGASGTPGDAPPDVTISGNLLSTGEPDTDVVTLSQVAGDASATKLFAFDDDFLITYGVGGGNGATIEIGLEAAAHNSADVTNVITATSPTTGTVVAGDIVRFPTFAPAWGNTQLATAIAALVASDNDPSMMLISGRILPANAATISTGLNNIEADGGRCTVIAQARKRTDAETEAEWRANLTAEWADTLDYRMALCAGDGLATFTDGAIVWQYARGFSTQAMRRLMAIPRYQTAWEYELGALEDFTTVDSNGILVGHDEKKSPGLKAAKFWTCYRGKQGNGQQATMLNFDMTRFRPIDRVRSVRVNRITNRMILEVQAVGLGRLGKTYDVTRTSPTTGTLTQKAIDALVPLFAQPIKNGFQNDISDWNASDLIVIGTALTIDPDTDAFELAVTINYTPKLPVGRVTAKFAVRLGV